MISIHVAISDTTAGKSFMHQRTAIELCGTPTETTHSNKGPLKLTHCFKYLLNHEWVLPITGFLHRCYNSKLSQLWKFTRRYYTQSFIYDTNISQISSMEKSKILLNQACDRRPCVPGFLKSFLFVRWYVCVYVSAPEAINNQ